MSVEPCKWAPRHLPTVVVARRPSDWFRRRYYVRCWECDAEWGPFTTPDRAHQERARIEGLPNLATNPSFDESTSGWAPKDNDEAHNGPGGADAWRMMGDPATSSALDALVVALGPGFKVSHSIERDRGDELHIEFPTGGAFVIRAERLSVSVEPS